MVVWVVLHDTLDQKQFLQFSAVLRCSVPSGMRQQHFKNREEESETGNMEVTADQSESADLDPVELLWELELDRRGKAKKATNDKHLKKLLLEQSWKNFLENVWVTLKEKNQG